MLSRLGFGLALFAVSLLSPANAEAGKRFAPKPPPKLVGLKPWVWGAVYVEGSIPAPKKWEFDSVMKRHTGKAFYTDETWLVGKNNGLANCVNEVGKHSETPTVQTPGEIVLPLKKNERVAALCFSPDNRYLYAAIVRPNEQLHLARWDLRTKERKSFGRIATGELVRKLEWVQGKLVVHRQEWIGWLDAKNGKLRAKLAQQYKPVRGLCYEEWSDGRLVKRACRPGQYHLKLTLAGDRVLFMDLQRRRRAYIVDYRKGRDIRCIKLPRESEDGILQPFVVCQDGSVGVVSTFALDPGAKIPIWSWDMRTGKQLQAMSYTPHSSAITLPNLLALSRDGTHLATTPATVFKEIHVLNARTGKPVHVCRTGAGCYALAASPKTNEFACLLDFSVEVWSMATSKRIARFKGVSESDDPGGLAYSPDGARLAWGGEQIHVVALPTK